MEIRNGRGGWRYTNGVLCADWLVALFESLDWFIAFMILNLFLHDVCVFQAFFCSDFSAFLLLHKRERINDSLVI